MRFIAGCQLFMAGASKSRAQSRGVATPAGVALPAPCVRVCVSRQRALLDAVLIYAAVTCCEVA